MTIYDLSDVKTMVLIMDIPVGMISAFFNLVKSSDISQVVIFEDNSYSALTFNKLFEIKSWSGFCSV